MEDKGVSEEIMQEVREVISSFFQAEQGNKVTSFNVSGLWSVLEGALNGSLQEVKNSQKAKQPKRSKE